MITNSDVEPKPFLRWAGGKSWFTKKLNAFLPESFSNYYEPFLGAGSIFIHLKKNGLLKKKIFLSDTNNDLINAFQILRDYPNELVSDLKRFRNTEAAYYRIRNQQPTDKVERAGRFLFLNRTSFNGIYRENLKGIYNVPYGYKKYSNLFDIENLHAISELLQGADLATTDFSTALQKVKKNDLIFLDPPYTVAHENNGFVKYNQKIFSWDDQIRLHKTAMEIDAKGAFFVMTNAYHQSISDIYAKVPYQSLLQRYSVVGGSKAKRDKYHEIILTNVKC